MLLSVAIFYFAFHMLTGEQGVLNWLSYNSEIKSLERNLEFVSQERDRLQSRADALSPRQLDMDLVDERARVLLGYVHPDEVVIQLSAYES